MGVVCARLRAGADQVPRPARRHSDQHLRGTGDAGVRRAAVRCRGAEGGAGRDAAGAAVLRRGGDRSGAAHRSRRSCSRAIRKIWHYDRETHVITVSDEITGEDGLVEFDGASEDGKVLYDGLGLTLTSGPLARVDVSAEFHLDPAGARHGRPDQLSDSELAGLRIDGMITSYSLTADNWPKHGAGIGDGWEVAEATASTPSMTFRSRPELTGSKLTVTIPITVGSVRQATTTHLRGYAKLCRHRRRVRASVSPSW